MRFFSLSKLEEKENKRSSFVTEYFQRCFQAVAPNASECAREKWLGKTLNHTFIMPKIESRKAFVTRHLNLESIALVDLRYIQILPWSFLSLVSLLLLCEMFAKLSFHTWVSQIDMKRKGPTMRSRAQMRKRESELYYSKRKKYLESICCNHRNRFRFDSRISVKARKIDVHSAFDVNELELTVKLGI